MEKKGIYNPGKVRDLLVLLKAFSREELGRLFVSVLDFYGQEDRDDFSVIKTYLESHVDQVYHVMQSFRL